MLKKLLCAATLLTLLLASSVTAFAASTQIIADKEEIILAEADKEFSFSLNIKTPDKTAGIELGFVCSDGTELTKASFSEQCMSAPPTEAEGMYWTSFFDGENTISEETTATLSFLLDADTNAGSVLLKEVNILTKSGVGVSTEKLHPEIRVKAATSESGLHQTVFEEESGFGAGSTAENTDISLGKENEWQSGEKTSSDTAAASKDGNTPKTGEGSGKELLILTMAAAAAVSLARIGTKSKVRRGE